MLEVYNNDSILCIVLEYVAGQTLFDLLIGNSTGPTTAAAAAAAAASSQKMPEDKSRPIASQLIAALAHMHSKRIVHRDKHANPPKTVASLTSSVE